MNLWASLAAFSKTSTILEDVGTWIFHCKSQLSKITRTDYKIWPSAAAVLSWPARLSPYWTMIWTLPEKSFNGKIFVKTRDIILSLWQWNIDIDVLKSKRTTSQYWRINCLRITCRIKIILIPPAELLCQLCFNLPNPRQTYFGSCEK